MPPEALAGLVHIACPHPQAEAMTIALALGEALQRPGRTAALVTPDRALARRVRAELARCGIEIDDSAGRPLLETPPGAFLRLVAEMVASRGAPVNLLACLKHPLAAGGLSPARFRQYARGLELAVLRGPRPAPGLAGVLEALRAARDGDSTLLAWMDDLRQRAGPFAQLMMRPVHPREMLKAHVALAEWLAASDSERGDARLWAEEAGEQAAEAIAELAQALDGFTPIAGADYPALFTSALAGEVVRPRYRRHPRVAILGPLEARLLQFDLMILGGLNEGTWPPAPPVDPWLSRPMRKAFGLPAPERLIGLAAHDFVQTCAAPEVMITRATRVEGIPTVPARWLLRLEALLAAVNDGKPRALPTRSDLGIWRVAIDRVPGSGLPGAPEPRPPPAARPNRLSVTEIETWRRDPYAIYARHILKLAALEPLDADPTAADYGQIIHNALATFVRQHRNVLPDDALERLLDVGRRQFGAVLARPGVWAFWWPRFCAVAAWFVEHEGKRRTTMETLAVESRGSITLELPGDPFLLTARADRIDRRRDGGLVVIDYKTGALPGRREVWLGFAPQLPLEAAIAAAGGFPEVPAHAVAELRYWRLSGGDPPGQELAIDGATVSIDGKKVPLDPEGLAAAALAGVQRLVVKFRDPATPYRARPLPDWAPRFSDYGHLARVKEWSAVEDE